MRLIKVQYEPLPHVTDMMAAGAALEDARPLAHNGYKVPLARNLMRQALDNR